MLAAPDINRRLSRERFVLARCDGCGLWFVVNPPPDLGRFYRGGYHRVPESLAALEPQIAGERFKIELLRPWFTRGPLLEVGPGVGLFAAAASAQGFDVHTIERDDACARFLRERVGVLSVNSDDPAAALHADDTTYNVICFWHSLEHLPRPWDVLEAAAARLADGGLLAVAAPHPESLQARRMGARWPHHDLPRHLFGLTPRWLASWAEDNGLEVVLATTADEGSRHWNRFSWGKLVQNLLPPPLAASGRINHLAWRAGLTLAEAAAATEDREGMGCCYTMLLRRPPG